MQKPIVVEEYNMGGVDQSDQMLAYYGFTLRTVKWWRRAFSPLRPLYCECVHTVQKAWATSTHMSSLEWGTCSTAAGQVWRTNDISNTHNAASF